MRSRSLTYLAALAIVLLAFALRISGGPGPAYPHGVGGVADEPAYIGEGAYLYAAVAGTNGDERFFSYTPPVHQLLLAFAPAISPFRLEPRSADVAAPLGDHLRSPDGRPYTIAYLPAGSSPEQFLPALSALYNKTGDVGTYVRDEWEQWSTNQLSLGNPVILSVLTPNSSAERQGAARFATDPLLRRTEAGLEIIDPVDGALITLLPSLGVNSVGVAIGADDPLSISLATIDRANVLRVWRMAEQQISPWGAGLLFSQREDFTEAATVAAGPSGDLLLISAKTDRGWELLTYETTSSISLIGRSASAGPLSLQHLPAQRETVATDNRGGAWNIVGGPIAGARLVVALIGALGALCAWFFGWIIGGRRFAILAALVFALDPLGVSMGRLAYQDETLATMIMASIAAMAGALSPQVRRPARWLLAMGLFAGLAGATKMFSLPLALFSVYLGALWLPRPARRALGAVAVLFAVAALVYGVANGSSGLIIAGVTVASLALFLVRTQIGAGLFRPALFATIGVLVGYLAPWIIRAVIIGIAGDLDPIASSIDMHISQFNNALRPASFFISTWWLWPTGLASGALWTMESGSVVWFPGIILAAGIAASAGAKQPLGRALGVVLLLLWASWAIPIRYQMAYYALPACVAAGAALVAASRERPHGGRIAIVLAILAPIGGMIAYESRVDALPLAALLASAGALLVSRPLRDRPLPVPLAIIAWVIGSICALAVGISYEPPLALLAGALAGIAAAGGWRAAPIGASLAGATLLIPQTLELIDFRLPGGMGGWWILGEHHQIHPIGLLIVIVIAASLAFRQRWHLRSKTAD